MNIKDNIKNIIGWKTSRKIVVISIDDYGNVKLDSPQAHERLKAAGLINSNRFNVLDTLETRVDLEMLYDVLRSVKDKHGKHAVFTPFALPCNLDFEKIAEEKFEKYHYELLPQTFDKLTHKQPEAYKGAWELWKEGLDQGLMVPQFHGREHLNLKVFKEKMSKKSDDILIPLKNRSSIAISDTGYPTINYTAAFDFWKFEENKVFDEMIKDGLQCFEQVYGYKSILFNPPGGREHPVIHKVLIENGVRFLDTPWIKKEHQGNGKYKKTINYTGKRNKLGQLYQVRNVVFEPNNGLSGHVTNALNQIEMAFRWKRPAIISSHRVNFCGHIDPENRIDGLSQLRTLLQEIVKKWPEVEFMAAHELGEEMEKTSS